VHILLIHQAFVTIAEPGGTRHHEMAKALVQKGHTVTIIASTVSYLTGKTGQPANPDRLSTDTNPGISLIYTYTYPALHRSFFHRLLSFISFMISSFIAALRVRNVDLVWGTSPPIFQGFTAWLVARLKGAAFVFEVRDLWPAFAIAIGVLKNPILIRLSLWLEHFLYSKSDTVMVNSPGFIDHVRLKGARRIELVPNGADPEMFCASEDRQRKRILKKHEGDFICLYAGAHGLSNDLEVVLDAAALLYHESTINFYLIGDGKEKPNLQSKAAGMGLLNTIFLPPVPKEEMVQVLSEADACIAILKPLDLYKTTYPNKVFDYMASGKPVLLAIDGVIREVVEAASAGLFIHPGDPQDLAEKVLYLKNHPKKTALMGKNGREYILSNFNRSVISDRLNVVLESTQESHHLKVKG
jgi:glycosyltransferase involved in cell wall biosynthesis